VLPFGLELEPDVVDQALAQLSQLPARGERRRRVLAEQVDVRIDRHRLARRAVEVRRRAGGHDEVRVVAHQHVRRGGLGEAVGLRVHRPQVREVLVHQRRDDQVIVL
jgi:hypothetical protein